RAKLNLPVLRTPLIIVPLPAPETPEMIKILWAINFDVRQSIIDNRFVIRL
ncbi:MAG: hypothetical protein CEN92_191, partial [Candidatus Berkelbacteria bacterium Licking1014_96]